MSQVAEANASGALPGRLWMYSNYHCNLACSYCLTESAPQAAKRELPAELMFSLARDARELGFTSLGITGGEPFLLPHLPDTIERLAEVMPVIVLTNGTLFTKERLRRVQRFAGKPVALQISLDSPDAIVNDTMRGPHNFHKVIEAIPALVEGGVQVRIATTVEEMDDADMVRLCALHRELGVPDEDHVVRPIVRRGRAVDSAMGVEAQVADLPPELTISADGAFWSPFGPTVHSGALDTDLLVSRTTSPLQKPAGILLGLVQGRPASEDSKLGIK
ncbi:MAG TPA: radical SAM protein [Actinomycetota bacterium]|nr:radical SAM protein [Actinomycetota bacterium]